MSDQDDFIRSRAAVLPAERLAAEMVILEGRSWAMRPEVLTALDESFGDRMLSGMEAAKGKADAGPPVSGNGIAVISIEGMIVPKLTFMAWLMGADYGLDGIMSQVRSAVADPEVRGIVLDFDSPGGLVDGVPEAATQLRQIRETSGKPLVAVANPLAASAAYWLAAQAHEIIVTPSGEVGSIGVYQQHRDVSGAMEQQGVKHTLISAGKYKVEGNPYEPLDPVARDAAQASVDYFYGMFTASVASGRSHPLAEAPVTAEDVQDGYGEGRTLTAKPAVKAGLADREATLSETISRMSSGRAKIRRTADDSGEPIQADDEGFELEAEASPEDRQRLLTVLAEMGIN